MRSSREASRKSALGLRRCRLVTALPRKAESARAEPRARCRSLCLGGLFPRDRAPLSYIASTTATRNPLIDGACKKRAAAAPNLIYKPPSSLREKERQEVARRTARLIDTIARVFRLWKMTGVTGARVARR